MTVSPYMQPQPPPGKPRITHRKQRVGLMGATNRQEIAVSPRNAGGAVGELYAWPRQWPPGELDIPCRQMKTVVSPRPPPGTPGSRPQSAPGRSQHQVLPAGRDAPALKPSARPQSAAGSKPSHRPAPQMLSRGTGWRTGSNAMAIDMQMEGAAEEKREETKEEVVERIMTLLRTRMASKRIITPVFRDMDVDHSGQLDYDEFEAAMRRLGMNEPKQKLRWVAEAMDEDGNGTIEYVEFVNAVCQENNKKEDGLFGAEIKEAHREMKQDAEAKGTPRQMTGLAKARPGSKRHLIPEDKPGKTMQQAWAEKTEEMEAAVAARAAAEAAAAAERAAAEKVAAERAAVRAAGRREQEAARALEKVHSQLRTRIALLGSCAAMFRRTATSPPSITVSDVTNCLARCAIVMSDETRGRFYAQLGLDAAEQHGGVMQYRTFVRQLLTTANIDAARVVDPQDDPHSSKRVDARTQRKLERQEHQKMALKKLNATERFQAVSAMSRLREKVCSAKGESFVTAFERMDTDGDHNLSYEEFGEVLKYWEPRLSRRAIEGLCALVDANGDGNIELREFAQVLEAEGDDLDVSAANLVLRYEKEHQKGDGPDGPPTRFGCTPTAHYGVQLKELLQGGPNSAYAITEDERFRPPISQTRRPEWQNARKTQLAHRRAQAHEKIREHDAQERRTAEYRDNARDRLVENRLDNIFNQKVRYLQSIALEDRTRIQ